MFEKYEGPSCFDSSETLLISSQLIIDLITYVRKLIK
jgi:hypothetical protein